MIDSTPPFENNSTPPLHLIVAQRGGQSHDGNSVTRTSLHWGFVHVEIDGVEIHHQR